MLAKYKKDAHGKLVKIADIYTVKEHQLKRQLFDREAVDICRQLADHGFEAYIVGGAVRDLLLGLKPKDFDITTDAHPSKVRKIFRNARIIGQRFKLVHITGSNGQIFEVATFRSSAPDETNIYGTLNEDALRRDFTLNALYYSPLTERIVDFHKGYMHLTQHVIEAVVPLSYSFTEDPVRMIRAVKYAKSSHSTLSRAIQSAIKCSASLLTNCSHSRLSEELIKILINSYAKEILESCYDFNLLASWLPNVNGHLNSLTKQERKAYWLAFNRHGEGRGLRIFTFLSSYINKITPPAEGNYDDVFNSIKIALAPIILPNRDIIDATHLFFIEASIPWNIDEESIIFSKSEKGHYFRKPKLR